MTPNLSLYPYFFDGTSSPLSLGDAPSIGMIPTYPQMNAEFGFNEEVDTDSSSSNSEDYCTESNRQTPTNESASSFENTLSSVTSFSRDKFELANNGQVKRKVPSEQEVDPKQEAPTKKHKVSQTSKNETATKNESVTIKTVELENLAKQMNDLKKINMDLKKTIEEQGKKIDDLRATTVEMNTRFSTLQGKTEDQTIALKFLIDLIYSLLDVSRLYQGQNPNSLNSSQRALGQQSTQVPSQHSASSTPGFSLMPSTPSALTPKGLTQLVTTTQNPLSSPISHPSAATSKVSQLPTSTTPVQKPLASQPVANELTRLAFQTTPSTSNVLLGMSQFPSLSALAQNTFNPSTSSSSSSYTLNQHNFSVPINQKMPPSFPQYKN